MIGQFSELASEVFVKTMSQIVGCCDGSLGLAWGRVMTADEASDRTWDKTFIAVGIRQVPSEVTVKL
jgi:hypothetical protein